MSDGISYFETEDTFGSYNAVEWFTPGLTVVIDQLALMTQVLPADALPYYNASVILGKDIGFSVKATQADGTTPFNLTNVPINFYGKQSQSDTVNVFFKSLAVNPADVLVPTPTNGTIQVYVRGSDYAGQPVGTTLFLYVDGINAAGNPVNIGTWTLTIVYDIPNPPSTGPAPAGGIPEAPIDGQLYGRESAAWAVVPSIPVAKTHFARIRVATDSINNTVVVNSALKFDTVDSDSDGFVVGAMPVNRLTIPTGLGGVYLIVAEASVSGNQSQPIGVSLALNGVHTLTPANQTITGPGSVTYVLVSSISQIGKLNDGDYIQIVNSGTAIESFTNVFLSLVRLGP